MSRAHPLGADGVGRDVLARLLYGGRISLLGALLAVAIGLLIGVPFGIVSGYYRGRFDSAATWVGNVILAAPAIIVLLVVMSSAGDSTYLAMIVFGVLLSPSAFRLTRSSVFSVREEPYIEAAHVSGLSDLRIMRRHVFPVVIAPSIIQAAQMFGLAIAVQAGIEFLGLGAAGEASWGSMLNDAFNNLYNAPILILWPTLAIALTITSLSLIANSLRDALGLRVTGGAKSKRREGVKKARLSSATARTKPSGAPLQSGALLVVDNLRVSYDTGVGESVVVDDVSLSVDRGEVLGLVGMSGSGKTQTAFAILDLLPEEADVSCGSMLFDGQEISIFGSERLSSQRSRKISYVPQEPLSNLDPCFRIGSQLIEPMCQVMGLSRRAAKSRALELLKRVGLHDPKRVFESYAYELSGGMAQRVLIAGAIACDPALLIADEPTTALDVTVQAEVLDLLRALQRDTGMGMLIVTHSFGVVADICDRVAVMQHGRVVETAPVADIFASPQHPYTRELLESTLDGAAPRSAARSAVAVTEGTVNTR
jgi:peptide/nickel transport system permease protein